MNHSVRCALGLLFVLVCGELQAAGSWVANAPATRVIVAGRETSSKPLRPSGAEVENRTIRNIVWHYRLLPGSSLDVKLCHPAGCTSLPTMRGTTDALAGLSADATLEFRFSLPAGQHPVTVGELQVIVNYR